MGPYDTKNYKYKYTDTANVYVWGGGPSWLHDSRVLGRAELRAGHR